ncbi:hypothetical protein Halhy_2323 [Haliscomenobacter hydrossis DSM 1100]|uniref:Uncharacterized protein n=1 Tax=Haliscomenobacter hydrossis (strain ATCC 27775 / DSM 1100 / LMG 10767 / O) TaxID=760192 RepID=F4KV75_HALH1|nr:hypothetical protein Halhy_2323 [Haliscomenobacter hydrossis DSM 1100]
MQQYVNNALPRNHFSPHKKCQPNSRSTGTLNSYPNFNKTYLSSANPHFSGDRHSAESNNSRMNKNSFGNLS